jgi:hypothetical protein
MQANDPNNNYNPNATCDDGSCFGNTPQVVTSCTDPTANNYDPAATVNDGSCLYDMSTNSSATINNECGPFYGYNWQYREVGTIHWHGVGNQPTTEPPFAQPYYTGVGYDTFDFPNLECGKTYEWRVSCDNCQYWVYSGAHCWTDIAGCSGNAVPNSGPNWEGACPDCNCGTITTPACNV